MKVLFRGKRSFLKPTGIALLCIALSFPAFAQEDSVSHKFTYGVHFGFTENMVDLYYTKNGMAQASQNGDNPARVPGFRMAVIGGVRLGNSFSLRVMPGVSTFNSKWEPGITQQLTPSPAADYKVESMRGELPVEVKFHPYRIVNTDPKLSYTYLVPYLTSGVGYSFDFATLRKEGNEGSIHSLNAHDLRYTCGVGIDCHIYSIKVGVEWKASFGLLPPRDAGSDPFYFHNGTTFSLGINIEA